MHVERILGHMIRSGLRDGSRKVSGFNLGGKAGLGMGALGLAFAAFEHFGRQSTVNPPTSSAPPAMGADVSPGSGPPPLPNSSVPPLPPRPTEPETLDAELLIRAMIAAAHADGLIDRDEERRIIESTRESGLDEEDREWLESEINRPRTMFEIVASAKTPELARQVYAASLLALRVDHDDERNYLQQLASSLHLTDEDVREIESDLGG